MLGEWKNEFMFNLTQCIGKTVSAANYDGRM